MADIKRKKCKRCKSLFLVSLPRKKGEDTEVGECSTPLCYALAHYSDDDWEGKATMAKARIGVPEIIVDHAFDEAGDLYRVTRVVDRRPDDFDTEALRRFP